MSRKNGSPVPVAVCERAGRLYKRYGWNTVCEMLGISSSTLHALKSRGFKPAPRPLRPIPHDFALVADGRSTTWLQKHYHARPQVVKRWLSEVPTERPKCGTSKLPMPADFAARLAASKTLKAVAIHYGVHWQTANRWRSELPQQDRHIDSAPGWVERRFGRAA